MQLSQRSTRTALCCIRSILLVFVRSCSSINNKILVQKIISPQPVWGPSKRKKIRGPWARAQCAHWLRRPWCVSVLDTPVSPNKMAGPIEMPFGIWIRVRPTLPVTDRFWKFFQWRTQSHIGSKSLILNISPNLIPWFVVHDSTFAILCGHYFRGSLVTFSICGKVFNDYFTANL